jgi:hypothetical protein
MIEYTDDPAWLAGSWMMVILPHRRVGWTYNLAVPVSEESLLSLLSLELSSG